MTAPTAPPATGWLTVAEASALTQMSAQWVRAHAEALGGARVGRPGTSRGTWRFTRDGIDAYFRSIQTPTARPRPTGLTPRTARRLQGGRS